MREKTPPRKPLRRGGEGGRARARADLVIRGGTVVDGTGASPYVADVAIAGGRIIHVGGVAEVQEGERCLEASGLLVAPGFIDIHSHSDFTLTVDPRAVSSIAQGVTLEVVGNCGHGCAPIGDLEAVKSNVYGYCEDHPISWGTVAEYLMNNSYRLGKKVPFNAKAGRFGDNADAQD